MPAPRTPPSPGALAVPLLVVGLLLAYRWALGSVPSGAVGYIALAVWLALGGLFLSRGAASQSGGLARAHAVARCFAGSSALVGLASASRSLDAGTFVIPAIAFAVSMVAYIALSALVTADRLRSRAGEPDSSHLLDIWLPAGFGAVLGRDLRILARAFWSPAPSPAQTGGRTLFFPGAIQAKPMLLALLAIAMVELVVVSILLSGAADWIRTLHFVFGAIFVVYVIGLIRSFAGLPTALDDHTLRIRMGLFFEADVETRNIAGLRRVSSMKDAGTPDQEASNAAIVVAPNIVLTTHEAVLARRLFKKDEWTRMIALHVDDPQRFMEAVNAA